MVESGDSGAEHAAGEQPAVPVVASAALNHAEARNLAFLVSHQLIRNDGLRLTSGTEHGEDEITMLATSVAGTLATLSWRLGNEDGRAELGSSIQ